MQKPFHTVQKTHSHFISAHLSELSACDYSPTQRENHPKRAFYTSHLEKLTRRGRIKLKSFFWHSLRSKFHKCTQFPFEKAAFWQFRPKCAVSLVTFCNRAFSLIWRKLLGVPLCYSVAKCLMELDTASSCTEVIGSIPEVEQNHRMICMH